MGKKILLKGGIILVVCFVVASTCFAGLINHDRAAKRKARKAGVPVAQPVSKPQPAPAMKSSTQEESREVEGSSQPEENSMPAKKRAY